MTSVPEKIMIWQAARPTTHRPAADATSPVAFELADMPVPELKAGEVLVEVAGCSICPTDRIGFDDGLPAISETPFTLSYEISGQVVAGDPEWIGKEVLVPAVLPCRQCPTCMMGRPNRCLNPRRPVNGSGIYHGLASHVVVSSSDLFEIQNRRAVPLEHLAVMAHGVAPSFQAVKRATLERGDPVIVIGLGKMGAYIVQMAKALGAGIVIAVDTDETRLRKMREYGADDIVHAAEGGAREVAAKVKRFRDTKGLPVFGWKIFEATGSKSGLEIALNLLGYTSKLVIAALGTAKVEYAVSRLMAFDAEIIGTWGSVPEDYPRVLEMVTSGMISVSPFVLTRPMSWVPEIFKETTHAPSDEQIILTTDDFGLDEIAPAKSCR